MLKFNIDIFIQVEPLGKLPKTLSLNLKIVPWMQLRDNECAWNSAIVWEGYWIKEIVSNPATNGWFFYVRYQTLAPCDA